MDALGFPLSLGSAIIGGVQGQFGALLNKWLDYKYHCQLLDDRALQNARNAQGKSLSFTRKVLAILTGIYIFLFPFIASYLQIPIVVFYSESNGWIHALFSGSFTIKIVTVNGLVLSPVQTYLASLAWTMYFGGKRV